MCCFSQPVVSVSATNIFARADVQGRQFLVYSMSLEARNELAMILPLPVRLPANEHDAEFIDLKAYPQFFAELDRGFPKPPTRSSRFVTLGIREAPASALPVVTVGDFEASFVPSVKDFSRLDERFRIDDNVWKKIPGYEDYSFAVFKLKPGAMTIHPMAFSFPRRDSQSVFFPTVHIHDGKVHATADFDHSLYCQPRPDEQLSLHQWEESYTHAIGFMQVDKAKGIIMADQHCNKLRLHGRLANRDTFLAVET
jgi:hypothetical protein